MASSIIHMCVANEVNKSLNIDNKKEYMLGAIAPDISKLVGDTRSKSHFYNSDNKVDINKFLNKYKDYMKSSFIMGYFVHLYTDYLWENYFLTEIINKNAIRKLDGSKVEKSDEMYKKLIYNDYTNLNIILLDEYKLDLSLFYNEFTKPHVLMDEIPIDKLNILLDKTGIIIENSKKKKEYTFNLENIKPFISISTKLINAYIKELKI